MLEIEKLLLENSQIIQDEIYSLLPPPQAILSEAMRYSALSAGKRLRPFMLISTADMFNVERKHSLRVASVLEIIHSYSLIHDDLPAMDNDDYRRGMPSCHKKFDEATAILAGDALLTLAFEILADEKTHPNGNVRCKLIKILAESIGTNGIAGGQSYDLLYERSQNPTYEQLYQAHWMKTARLFMACCQMGAILGNSSEKEFEHLTKFAESFGMAFQFIDDLEDLIPKAILNNNNMVKLIGEIKTKNIAKQLIEQARSELKHLTNSETLDKIALYLLEPL